MTDPLTAALQQMEAAMLDACAASDCAYNPALAAAAAHLAVPGNQLRGRICLDAAARLDLPLDTAIRLAAVCELLHNASLLHDDLIDRAPKRRGHASTWAQYGDGVAICSGDLMLGAAYDLAADLSREVQRLMHRRVREVVLGEAAELAALSNVHLTLAEYEELAHGKSASLLSLSLELPLLLSGHLDALSIARRLAACFAVSYQIVDDLADYTQDRQAHALNVLSVLSDRERLTVENAQRCAVERAIALLEEAFVEAARLPNDCAHVLVRHAERMVQALEAARLAPAMSLHE